jgi:AcrR family transcriptional regulator
MMAGESRRTKAEQREATKQTLVSIGREHFTARGYAQAAAEEIVAEAGLTRGALYHHFGSKEGLFAAVLLNVAAELAARIDAATAELDDPWQMLETGCSVFLDAATDPSVQRILLIDGPVVLGWQAWRKIDSETSMLGLSTVLNELQTRGELASVPVEALVHLLSGAMNEAALWIAQANDPSAALDDARAALTHLLRSLRA